MGKFSFVIESEDIIVTAFYGSSENIGTPTINIYSFVEVMFYYKGLHQVLSPPSLLSGFYLFVFADTQAFNLRI
jgi:hypothetical protein